MSSRRTVVLFYDLVSDRKTYAPFVIPLHTRNNVSHSKQHNYLQMPCIEKKRKMRVIVKYYAEKESFKVNADNVNRSRIAKATKIKHSSSTNRYRFKEMMNICEKHSTVLFLGRSRKGCIRALSTMEGS